MDFQNRAKAKIGSGAPASASETARARKERLMKLAMETIDLAKDPYFMKNHIGKYECKLCLTLHTNEGSYLTHTQGKRHQDNLRQRAARDAEKNPTLPALPESVSVRKFVKIGKPGYKVTKQQDPRTGAYSLLFQMEYPEIGEGVLPRHRVMSSFEQHIEPPDRNFQYLLFAAEPYETIAFKLPHKEVDTNEDVFWSRWDPERKTYYLQFAFKPDRVAAAVSAYDARPMFQPSANPLNPYQAY